MTDYEATVMLNEHRTVYPVFIIGRGRYVVRPDGQVNCWDAVGKSGKRWAMGPTVPGDSIWLPERVRERAASEVRRHAS